VRSSPVVPVLLGNAIPRQHIDKEGFAQSVLLLFTSWRSFTNLRGDALCWDDALDETPLSEASRNLLGNINVEYECADAR
ncbi:hypothetical protein EV363DRAFT_1078684, partial [Boletus edulis]